MLGGFLVWMLACKQGCRALSLQYISGLAVSSTGNMSVQRLGTSGGGHDVTIIRTSPQNYPGGLPEKGHNVESGK